MTLTALDAVWGLSSLAMRKRNFSICQEWGEATVEIVWDPPWHQSMITPEGKKALGL